MSLKERVSYAQEFTENVIKPIATKTNMKENDIYSNLHSYCEDKNIFSMEDAVIPYRRFYKACGVFGFYTDSFCKGFVNYYGKKSKGLEVMAGKGLLSKSIQEHGLEMIATDDKSWEISRDDSVETLSAIESFHKYKNEIDFIILSWIPFKDTEDDYLIMKAIHDENLDIDLVVISHKEYYGYTNSYKFWDNVVEIEKKDFSRKVISEYVSIDFEDKVFLAKYKGE